MTLDWARLTRSMTWPWLENARVKISKLEPDPITFNASSKVTKRGSLHDLLSALLQMKYVAWLIRIIGLAMLGKRRDEYMVWVLKHQPLNMANHPLCLEPLSFLLTLLIKSESSYNKIGPKSATTGVVAFRRRISWSSGQTSSWNESWTLMCNRGYKRRFLCKWPTSWGVYSCGAGGMGKGISAVYMSVWRTLCPVCQVLLSFNQLTIKKWWWWWRWWWWSVGVLLDLYVAQLVFLDLFIFSDLCFLFLKLVLFIC